MEPKVTKVMRVATEPKEIKVMTERKGIRALTELKVIKAFKEFKVRQMVIRATKGFKVLVVL
jgi:hypothetical protein